MKYTSSTRSTRRGGTGCSAISIEGAEDRAGEGGEERLELRGWGVGPINGGGGGVVMGESGGARMAMRQDRVELVDHLS